LSQCGYATMVDPRSLPSPAAPADSISADTTTFVTLVGDIDPYNAPRLAQHLNQLIDEGQTTIVLALEDLHFIDSSGLGVIVRAARQARDAGGHLALRGPTPSIKKVLEITGLDHILPMAE
jgi:anti-anti-sigma factor